MKYPYAILPTAILFAVLAGCDGHPPTPAKNRLPNKAGE